MRLSLNTLCELWRFDKPLLALGLRVLKGQDTWKYLGLDARALPAHVSPSCHQNVIGFDDKTMTLGTTTHPQVPVFNALMNIVRVL